jgi:hypothetical protein
MARKYLSRSTFFGFLMVMGALPSAVIGQQTPTSRQLPSHGSFQIRPVSMAHLYWHFMTYQNHLEQKATEQELQGKDGGRLRSQLQKQAGLSDADYAPIRVSSVRLSSKVKEMDARAAKIREAGISSSSIDQLRAVTVEREAAINSEILYLKQNLSKDNIRTFEAFLTKFFSLNNALPRTHLPAGQSGSALVQK